MKKSEGSGNNMPQNQEAPTPESTPLPAGTAQELTKAERKVLEILLSGGKMRGMYMFGRHTSVGAGRFEILTAKQVAAEERQKLCEIGTHKPVEDVIVEQLALKGYIEIPPSQGPRNRIATAMVLRNLRLV